MSSNEDSGTMSTISMSSDDEDTNVIFSSQPNVSSAKKSIMSQKRSVTVLFDPPSTPTETTSLERAFDLPATKVRKKVSQTRPHSGQAESLPAVHGGENVAASKTKAKTSRSSDPQDVTVLPSPTTGCFAAVHSNPSDWTVQEVETFISEIFDSSIAKKFVEEEVDGETLLSNNILKEGTLINLGLNTLGKRTKFEKAVMKLKGKSGGPMAMEREHEVKDRLLTHAEKRQMSCEDKRNYNTKKKLIQGEIQNEWKDEIPSFRHNTDELQRLEEFSRRLDKPAFTMKKCYLGKNAIKDMVKLTMSERRRKQKNMDALNSSTSDNVDSSDSLTPPPTPVNATKSYEGYFHPKLTQASSDLIIMAVTHKENVKDVQMKKHLLPLKKLFNLPLLRGQDKSTLIRALANSLIEHNYVSLEGDESNLHKDDIKLIKQLSL